MRVLNPSEFWLLFRSKGNPTVFPCHTYEVCGTSRQEKGVQFWAELQRMVLVFGPDPQPHSTTGGLQTCTPTSWSWRGGAFVQPRSDRKSNTPGVAITNLNRAKCKPDSYIYIKFTKACDQKFEHYNYGDH